MDLSVFNIYLQNLDSPLPIQAVRAHALNGMFYTEMDRCYHQWVSRLHHLAKNETLPFSLSSIFEKDEFLGFRVGALTMQAGERTREVWEKLLRDQAAIRLGSASLVVRQVEPGNPWPASYEKIWDTAPIKYGIRLAFDTPFRLEFTIPVNGNGRTRSHYSLLPTPSELWQWYARRWESLTSISLPPGFLRWVQWQVYPVEVQLETVFAYIEQDIEWKGVMGEVAYHAFGDSPDVPESRLPEYLRAFQSLAMLAEYSGSGEKTGMGMGRTRRVRTFSPYRVDPKGDQKGVE